MTSAQKLPIGGDGRIWQGIRANGANPMTIPGGHSIDALCFILGEFDQISARVTTQIRTWKHAMTGDDFAVDAPDTVSAAGVLQNGAEVSYQLASVPYSPSGTRMEIYGRKGTLVLTSNSVNIGPSQLFLAVGKGALAEVTPPDDYRLIPADMPVGRTIWVQAATVSPSGDFERSPLAHVVQQFRPARRHLLLG